MDKKTVVCLPTYNEASNIAQAVKAVLNIFPHSSILVIDDNSPDETGKIADRLASKDPRIVVLHRPHKQGLGKAYCHGFQYAINKFDADLIVQMDADLSHPPERLPGMLIAARDSDLVLGSRYVAGGCTENWSLLRRIISRFGAVYAGIILNLPVSDPTGGFKIWHRNLLEQIIDQPISSSGYVFQVETTFYAYTMGAKIIEIPISFTERDRGKSKMTLPIAIEAFWRVPLIRLRKNKHVLFYKK